MYKSIAVIALAAVALTATTPVLAGEGKQNNGLHLGNIKGEFVITEEMRAAKEAKLQQMSAEKAARMQQITANKEAKMREHASRKAEGEFPSHRFVVKGTVASMTSGSIVINVDHGINLPTLTNNLVTVNVDEGTRFRGEKQVTVALSNIKVGMNVVASGTRDGNTLRAAGVGMIFPKGKAYGEVTAKTPTSITVKNNVSGETQTFTTDEDTTVKINGEEKTVADIQVGDTGYVKFKARVSGFFAKMVSLFR